MIAKRLATILVKRPKTVLLVYTLFTIVVGINIQNVYMQSDLATFLPQDDPSLELLMDIYEEFQIGSTIIVYVEADDIRDPYVLREMDRVAGKVNKYELDRGLTDGVFSVQSIAALIKDENAKPYLPAGLGGTGRFEIPEDPNLLSRYLARPLIQETEGLLYLDSFEVGLIIFQLAENSSYLKVLEHIKAAIQKEARYADMTVTGGIAVQEAMRENTLQSLTIVFPLAAVFVAINLFIFHRTIKGLVIGFMPLGYALILTFGILGIIHPEMTILTIAVAALLLGLGVDYSIYLANRYAEEYEIADRVERVEKTLGRTGKAVFLCAFTTIIGFGSLMTSSIPPMAIFGLGCALGISFAFISATIIVPCLCLILKYEKREEMHSWRLFAKFAIDYRKRLFAIACFFVVLSLLVVPQIKTDVNYLEMAPEGLPEVEKLLEYSRNFGGGANFNALLIQTEPNGLTYPETINAIYELEEQIRATGASAYSIADELIKINDILDRNVLIERLADFADIYQIIFDKVAKTGIVTDDYSKTIVVVSFTSGVGIDELNKLVNNVNAIAAHADIPRNGKVYALAGQDVISVEINKQISTSQTQSLIVALLLVLACLIIGFNSSIIGLLAIFPVLVILAWEPGALVTLNIPLSIVNLTVASIMIGTGIDYSVQTTQRIREEIERGLTKIEALRTTLETTGLSLLAAATTTSAALLSTFAVAIPSLHQFSIMVITLILLSLAASIFILPTVLTSRFMK